MISSIKRFLLINLLLSLALTSVIIALFNFFLDDRYLQNILDSELAQAGSFFQALLDNKNYSIERIQHIQNNLNQLPSSFTCIPSSAYSGLMNSFELQVWDKNGKLMLHSPNAPTNNLLSDGKPGFSTTQVGLEYWRVYTTHPTANGLTIAVADRYNIRHALENHLTLENLLILLLAYPLLSLVIWLIVGHGLVSLKTLTRQLATRPATDFMPIDPNLVPIEIKPLIEELNKLFSRLHEAFERNKRFSADAAHELRTPLAALKTQAQVALHALSDEERKTGLKNVILSVDRCVHVAQQLLTLSRLDPEAALHDVHLVDLTKLTAEVLAQIAPIALDKNIDMELKRPNVHVDVLGNETVLSILIRNIVDNAIRYTPENGNVQVEILDLGKNIVLRIIDSGAGIPPELRERVFERFYRILGSKQAGSGLGLAIVQQIAELHQAKVLLSTPPNGIGLQVDIIFPTPSEASKLLRIPGF